VKGDANKWFHTLNHSDGISWEDLKKDFHMKYYSPFKAYCDRSHIYIFWPHHGESIAQAWGRLKGLILKNPNHGFSQGITLVIFYVRLAKPYKEFLDNSSEGSFTHCTVAEEENIWKH
jgi:hypothetical protein